MDFLHKKCIPCEGGVKPFGVEEIKKYMPEIKGWMVLEGIKLHKEFTFEDLEQSMIFVNKVAEVAEHEKHHPDIFISYNRVRLTIWTHAIGGLSENDFILAAKIDNILEEERG